MILDQLAIEEGFEVGVERINAVVIEGSGTGDAAVELGRGP
jgi:hypothetical protein